jgi:hypothetical protein
MAKKPTVNLIGSGYASKDLLNNNFEALRDAFDNTLSLDGSTPNAMGADLDMDGNNILNARDINADRVLVGGSLLSPSSVAVDAENVNFTPTGTIASTDVQSALAEVATDLSASTGSSLVGYTQGGTGSTSRTVGAKLQETVSVKDFGADPTGATDSATAIQAALNSGAKVVEFPVAGSYTVGSALTVPASVQIEGNDATVTASSSFTLFNFTDGGAIRNLNIVGSVAAGTYDASSIAIEAEGTNNHPAAPTYITGPKIENCTITNFGFMAVRLAYVKKAEVRGNRIADIGYTGVGGVSCEDVIVDGNTIEEVTPGSSGGDAYGVFIDRQNGLSETSDPRSYRCIITNNIIKNVVVSGGGTNGQGIDTHAGVDFLIDSNVINGCQRGVFVTSSAIGALGEQLGAKRCVVSNNTIVGTGAYGILLDGANSGAYVVDWTEDCVITGNIVVGFGKANDGLTGGIHLQFTKNTIVSNNMVKNSNCNLINLDTRNIGFTVSGNILTDPWDDTYPSPNCIRIGGNDSRGIIIGNTFRFEDATLGTYVATMSVRIESALTGLNIELGKCSFEGIDATHLGLSLGTTTGVYHYGFYEASGTGTISMTSGGSTALVAVTLPKRFPYTPVVTLTPQFPISGGGKAAMLSVGNSGAGTISATGFTAYANPSDLATWSSTGTVNFTWHAR